MVCMFIPFKNLLNDFMFLDKQALLVVHTINYISPLMTHMAQSADLHCFLKYCLMAMLFYGGKGQKWQDNMNLMASYVRYDYGSLIYVSL